MIESPQNALSERSPLRAAAPPPSATAVSVDDAIEAASMGRYQYYLIALTGLAWTAESMEMMLLSFIKQPLQCEWRISDASAALITTAVGLGMLSGALFWGALADRHGRKSAFLACTASTFAFGIASAMAPSYPALLLARALVGFAVGGLPVSFSLLMEWLPVRARGSWGMAISLFWALGAVLEALLAMLVLPSFGWRALIAASSLPLLAVLLLSWPLRESPRWLMAHHRTADAHAAIAWLAVAHGRPPLRAALVPDQKTPADHDRQIDSEAVLDNNDASVPVGATTTAASAVDAAPSRMRQLFSPPVRALTLKVALLWWAAAFTYYGLVMLQPELLALENAGRRCGYAAAECAALDAPRSCVADARCAWRRATCTMARAVSAAPRGAPQCANRLRRADFVASLWGALGELPGIVACLALVEAAGRRAVLAGSFGATAAAAAALAACAGRRAETALFFVGRGASAGAFQATYLYTNELFPASVRATAMGACSGAARTALMAAPALAQWAVGASPAAAVGAFAAAALAAVWAAWAVRIETRGRRTLTGIEQLVERIKAVSPV